MLPEESAAPVKDNLGMKLCPKVPRLTFTEEDVQLHYNATQPRKCLGVSWTLKATSWPPLIQDTESHKFAK